jgi:methylglutaconyl-CoA hydratase
MESVLTVKIDACGVAMIGLNRPQVHNAFDVGMMDAISKTITQLATDDKVRLAVIFGHGKSFCAGGDLNWMRSMKDFSYEENLKDSDGLAAMFAALHTFPKPLIGIVHGVALGGGSGMAAVCDYVLATDDATFGFTETRLGLVPAVISPYALEKIGVSAAHATFLSGAKFSATDALRIGLVHQLTSAAKLDAAREKLVAEFLQAAPQATIAAKALIRTLQQFKAPEEARGITVETIAKTRIGAEAQEGISALLESRKPSWRQS